MTNHDVDQRATPAMLTFNVDSSDFVQCLSLSSTHNVDYTYIPKTIKPDSFQPGLGHTGNVFCQNCKQNNQTWLFSTMSRSYWKSVVKIASKTIKTDSFQPCLGHTRSTWRIRLTTGTWLTLNSILNLETKSNSHSTFWDIITQNFCSSQTSNYVEDEPNPRQPSFAFRDFYSGRRWYNPFLSEMCGKWSPIEMPFSKYWKSDKFRQEQQDADAMESVQVRDTT